MDKNVKIFSKHNLLILKNKVAWTHKKTKNNTFNVFLIEKKDVLLQLFFTI